MKNFLLMIVLFIFTQLFAAEFVVTDFQEQSMSIELQRNPVKDVNGEYAALIKISTDLQPFTFETNIGVVKTEKKVGEFWAYIPKGSTQLIFSKKGFNRYRYSVPITMKESTVYSLILSSIGYGVDRADENLIDITFKLPEEGVYISKDDSSPIEFNNKLVEYRLPKGDYTFKFFKGNRSCIKQINVTSDAMIDVVLVQAKIDEEFKLPGIIKVTSIPDQAEIFIDNLKFGITPLQFSITSGNHVLKLMKELYYSYSTNIDVEEGKVLDIPVVELMPNFGIMNLSTDPDSCDIYIDDKYIGMAPVQEFMIESGEHQLRIEKKEYINIYDDISIADNDKLDLSFELDYAYGKLAIKSLPESGATVYIDGKEVGKTPYEDTKIRVGEYGVKIAKEQWIGTESMVDVISNEKTTKDMILTNNFSDLFVKSIGSELLVDGEIVGQDSVHLRLPAGKHDLEARKGEFLRDYQEIYSITGKQKSVFLTPEAQYASLSIISTPQETEGADVFINGELNGKTPLIKKVYMGKTEILLKHPLFNPYRTLVNLEKDEQRTLAIALELYKGSARHKAAIWKRSKWISLASSILIYGAGVYCNMLGDAAFDDYDAATTTAAATSYRDDLETWYLRRDISYGVSIAPVVWFFYSWIKEAGYNKQANKQK